MKTLLSMAPVSVVAWTGGSSPAKPSQVSAKQAGIQKFLFGQQVETFRAYWGDNPNWDTLHIFFRRARMGAHIQEQAVLEVLAAARDGTNAPRKL